MFETENASPFARLLSKWRLGCHPHYVGASGQISDTIQNIAEEQVATVCEGVDVVRVDA